MAIDTVSVLATADILDGSTTVLADQDTAQTATIGEGMGGLPSKIAGEASDVNIKLGTLTDAKVLKVKGAQGISVKIADGGTAIPANPFLLITDLDDGIGISEIWVSNSGVSEADIIITAAE